MPTAFGRPFIRAFRCLLGADRRHSRRVCRQKRKKTLGAAGRRQKAFSQGSRIKTQGKKQKTQKAFSQGSRIKRREKNKNTEGILSGFVWKNAGKKTKKTYNTCYTYNTYNTYNTLIPALNCSWFLEFVTSNADRNADKEHAQIPLTPPNDLRLIPVTGYGLGLVVK